MSTTLADPETGEDVTYPDVGDTVQVNEQVDTRTVGEEDSQHVEAGTYGTVKGWVAEWHDVHVELDDGRHVWIDPCNLDIQPCTCADQDPWRRPVHHPACPRFEVNR